VADETVEKELDLYGSNEIVGDVGHLMLYYLYGAVGRLPYSLQKKSV